MKCIVFGLGNFGAALCTKLTELGNEVIGVDKRLDKVEQLKDKITHTVCLDSTDVQAVNTLPVKEADLVVIGIGEDEGASLLTTALMKQLKARRIVSRAVSPLQEIILEAMGVTEIIHPEAEMAEKFAKKLQFVGVYDSFQLTKNYNLVEIQVPSDFVGKTVGEIPFAETYKVAVLATVQQRETDNLLGKRKKILEINQIATPDTRLEEGDLMVLFGHVKDIQKLLEN
ncbi:MAG TPA: TrkA family potassium uptake protein [Saprospiraceae bacterium]|mgnify:CR=1 FL=1|nr:TrkA family potassium uptake protein [Saprospiraceae bacterium]